MLHAPDGPATARRGAGRHPAGPLCLSTLIRNRRNPITWPTLPHIRACNLLSCRRRVRARDGPYSAMIAPAPFVLRPRFAIPVPGSYRPAWEREWERSRVVLRARCNTPIRALWPHRPVQDRDAVVGDDQISTDLRDRQQSAPGSPSRPPSTGSRKDLSSPSSPPIP